MPDPRPRPERLLLVFGLPLALGTLAFWTWADHARYGIWTLRGLEKGLFIGTAVLLLYVIMRIARIVTDRDPT